MNRLLAIAIATTLALGCGRKHKEDEPTEPKTPDDPVAVKVDSIRASLMANHLDADQIVSRWDDGRADDQGDSLLFSGIALGVMPCSDGWRVMGGLARKIVALDGHFERFTPLPSEYANDAISLDGEIGALWGLVRWSKRCDESGALQLWARHAEAVLADDGRLSHHSDAKFIDGLDYPWRLFARQSGADVAEPHWTKKALFETEILAWAAACKQTQSACFRVHLAFLLLDASSELGEPISKTARKSFCKITDGMDIPWVDAWCGRVDRREWILGYQLNSWVYRHQRCGAWESPDGKPGKKSPGLDVLVMSETSYKEQEQ